MSATIEQGEGAEVIDFAAAVAPFDHEFTRGWATHSHHVQMDHSNIGAVTLCGHKWLVNQGDRCRVEFRKGSRLLVEAMPGPGGQHWAWVDLDGVRKL